MINSLNTNKSIPADISWTWNAIASILEWRIDPWLARRFSSVLNPSWTEWMPYLDVWQDKNKFFIVATYTIYADHEIHECARWVSYTKYVSEIDVSDLKDYTTSKVDKDYLERQMKGCLWSYIHREEHSLYEVYKQFYRWRYIVNKWWNQK